MDQNMQNEPRHRHVAIIPTPGMGHLIPLVQLAKLLVVQHGFSITFIIPTDGSAMETHKAILQSLPQTVSSIFLPPSGFHDLPEDTKIETRIALTLHRSLPALRHSLKLLNDSTLLVAVVVDHFGVDAFDVARELGISPYLFFPTTAMVLSLVFELPKLDEMLSCEFRDLPEPIQLPGCVPVHGRDLLDPLQDRKNEAYKWMIHFSRVHHLADGILINSFMELELGALKALKQANKPPIYPVGPLIQTNPNGVGSESERWLDQQPPGSVLFVSFGSGGTLSQEQLSELAHGLEMSGQRFLWVVRSPHEKATNAAYFSVQSKEHHFDFLPKGFMDRTKGVGLVVLSWAPQIQILRHSSTGGFLSHCGWNSILESIVHGVPIIAWPLYAEQRMNAVLVAEDLKVAMRVEANNGSPGIVKRESIASYARRLIEGEDGKLLRSNLIALKDSAAKTLSEGGSSKKSLEEVVQIWRGTPTKN